MIDVVVPMVFPSDPLWVRDLVTAYGWDSSDDVRYRSWGNEELQVRCIRKFMPWVRDIIILLARESQVQPWMVAARESQHTIQRLRLVFHHEFMPKEYLPTFNSRAIEMFLHRIPGLSNRFLYANDDMFPLSPLREEDFFVGDMPCQKMKEKEFPENPNNFQTACMGGLNFVAEEFGRHFTTTWLKNGHSIAPILKSVCKHLWERGEQQILASISQFRAPKNFNQYIYVWWQYFSGLSIDRVPNRRLISVKNNTIEEAVAAIEAPDCGIICINDHEQLNDTLAFRTAVNDAIKKKLEG